MPDHWQVLIVVTAGAFLANLDLFIVNIAFPAIQADFPGAGLVGALLGAERLRDRLRRAARAGRPAGRPRRAQADLPRRPRRSSSSPRRSAPLADRAVDAGRRAGDPGGRGGADDPHLAGAAAARVPARAPSRGGRPLDGGRGRWPRPSAPRSAGLLVTASWRWVFLVNLPLGAAHRRRRRGGSCASSRDPAQRRLPGPRRRRPALPSASARWRSASSRAATGGGRARPVVGVEVLASASLAALRPALGAPPGAGGRAGAAAPARGRGRPNTSVFLFSMGFFPLLLATVLFLTEVWHYRCCEAGLAVAPGPLMVALLSWPAGRLAGRVGPRAPGAARGHPVRGRLRLVDLAFAGEHPDYLRDMLPAMILVGTGREPHLPDPGRGGRRRRCPPARSATGSAVFNMSRQIGGVVGVAVLVAILGAGVARRSTGSAPAGPSWPAPPWRRARWSWCFLPAARRRSGLPPNRHGPPLLHERHSLPARRAEIRRGARRRDPNRGASQASDDGYPYSSSRRLR